MGMGSDLNELPGVKPQLQLSEGILGWSLLELTAEQICQTLYTQPALFMASALLTDHMRASGRMPDCTAGHSLGEYSALYAAEVFDYETGLRLVKERAELMSKADKGVMAALMGFDRDKLEALCATVAGAEIANDNSPDQVVITGTEAGVQSVIDQLQPKRAKYLPVSGAFHSSLMTSAAAAFATTLADVPFAPPKVPVYSNVTGKATQDPEVLKENLMKQMTSPVLWRTTVLTMAADGVTSVWEVGPGAVLTGLVKRTVAALERVNIDSIIQIPTLNELPV
jgi:[acyl-carrier-protein] S-malonyltransferase